MSVAYLRFISTHGSEVLRQERSSSLPFGFVYESDYCLILPTPPDEIMTIPSAISPIPATVIRYTCLPVAMKQQTIHDLIRFTQSSHLYCKCKKHVNRVDIFILCYSLCNRIRKEEAGYSASSCVGSSSM